MHGVWRRWSSWLTSRRWGLAFLLVLVATSLLLLSVFSSKPTVRLAMTSFPPYNYFYLASRVPELSPGIDLVVRQYSSLADQRRAFEQDAADAITTTLPEALAICQEAPARCPLIVLVLDESAGADQLLARVSIADVAGLKGRRVGLEHSVLGEYFLLRGLDGSGVDLSQLLLRYDGPLEIIRSLREGELDAVVTYAPHLNTLKGDPRFHVLFDSRRLPHEVVDVLAVDPGWARRHPQRIASLIRSWWAARAYAAEHAQAAVALMAQREQIMPEEFLAFERLVRYPGPEEQRALLAPQGVLHQVLQRIARQMWLAGRVQPAPRIPAIRADYLPKS